MTTGALTGGIGGTLPSNVGVLTPGAGGLGTMSSQNADAVAITGGTVRTDYGGLKIEDIDGDNTLCIKSLEHLAADVNLSLSVSGVSREVTFAGDATLSGTNTGDVTLSTITGTLPIASGGTGAATAANARTALGLGSIAVMSAASVGITGGSITGITDLAIADGGTGASTAANARTALGLGTIATQNANAVAITGGSVTVGAASLGVTDGLGSFAMLLGYSDGASANRTLTLILSDANRSIALGGNLTLASSLTTVGAFGVTLTATNTTSVTLPTAGILANRATAYALAMMG